MTHDPKVLAMARRVCAEHDPDKAYQFLEGRRDDYPPMTLVLAAIVQTSEAAARHYASATVPVKVTQEARNAAADWLMELGQGDCGSMRSGMLDHHALVQFLARFEASTIAGQSDGVEDVDDPANICAGLSDEAIEAGIAAWRQADVEMMAREHSAEPEDMADWDEGMIVAAIYKAVTRATLTPSKGGSR